MDDDPEFFPCHSSQDEEAMETYFPQEFDFMPFAYLFDDPRLSSKRAEALSTIVHLTRNRNVDVYIPYMAMNYYDRYVSRNPAPSRRKNHVAAVCCLTLAFKMRRKDFCVIDFKQAEKLRISRKALDNMELEIFRGLDWRLWTITPLSFLLYYYPRYKELGGFKWSPIVNIIIEAQADNKLARYKHSEIASSSLLAAAAILYPREFLSNFVDDVDRAPALCHLIQMCGTKNITIQRAEPREPRTDEASTSYNANDSADAEPDDDDQAIPRRHGKEVASSSSQNDHDSLKLTDDQAIPRRPGKEVVVCTSPIDDCPSGVRDHQRRPAREFMASTSQVHDNPSRRPAREFIASTSQVLNDPSRRPAWEFIASTSQFRDDPTGRPAREFIASTSQVRDDPSGTPGREFMASTSRIDDDPSRRPGRDFMGATSQVDEDPLAVKDEQEFSRKPGKEVVTISQSSPSEAVNDDDEQEDPRSLLEELGFTSETIDSFLEFTKEQDDPKSRLKKLGFSSRIIDPLFAFTDEQEIPSTSGSLAVFTSQGGSSEAKDELEIPQNPIQDSASSSQITYPLSVTDEPGGNPYESSGSMVAFPSQGNSSAVTDELEIPRRPGKEELPTTSEVTEEQEIPRRPGKEELPTTSEVTEEQEIPRRPGKEELPTTSEVTEEQEIPRRPGKEEERRRLVAALDAALEAGLKAAQEDTIENQQNLLETSRRFAKEVESATSSLQAQPETSETETSRRFITTLQSLFDASQRSFRVPSGLSDMSGFEPSQRLTNDVESASGSLPAHPATSETQTSRRATITTLRSLFDASQRNIRIPSEISELSVHTPPLNISDASGFEASESSVEGKSENPGNSEIETPPVHLLPSPPPPPPPHTSPSSTRNTENCCSVL